MIVIGVAGMEKQSDIIGMLRKIFSKAQKRVNIIESCDFQALTAKNRTNQVEWESSMRSKTSDDSLTMQQYVEELRKNKSEIVIIKILPQLLESQGYCHIDFDIIVYSSSENEENSDKNHLAKLFQCMTKESIALVNIDDENVFDILNHSVMSVVTYGMGSKATITASSISDEETEHSTLIICLQRNLPVVGADNLEPEEFPVTIKSSGTDTVYNALAAVTTSLICGITEKSLEEILL